MATDVVINFADAREKQRLWSLLRGQKGKVRVELSRYRPRRSDPQNRYYWGVIVPAVRLALLETQGEQFDPEQAHEFTKAMFLSRPVVDKRTGELLATVVGSSAVLTTEQFGEYVEHIRRWLGEFCGVTVPDPEPFGATRAPTQAAGQTAGRQSA